MKSEFTYELRINLRNMKFPLHGGAQDTLVLVKASSEEVHAVSQ